MTATAVTDIIHFGLFYRQGDFSSVFHFSAGMAIISLLLKPVSCFFVYQMYRERGGDYNVNFGKWLQMSLCSVNIREQKEILEDAIMCHRGCYGGRDCKCCSASENNSYTGRRYGLIQHSETNDRQSLINKPIRP